MCLGHFGVVHHIGFLEPSCCVLLRSTWLRNLDSLPDNRQADHNALSVELGALLFYDLLTVAIVRQFLLQAK